MSQPVSKNAKMLKTVQRKKSQKPRKQALPKEKKEDFYQTYLPAAIRQDVDKVTNSIELENRREFVKTLIYPDQYQHRMPDDLTQPTNLYRSLREFALVANMDGTVNAGKFSFAVKPILGLTDTPNHYQVGIVDTTTGWPTDFSVPDSYVRSNLNSNPRIDPMIQPLLSSNPGQYYQNFSTLANLFVSTATANFTGYPFGLQPLGAGIAHTINSNLSVPSIYLPTLSVTSTPLQGAYTASNVTLLKIPAGVFNIQLFFHVLGTFTFSGGTPNVIDVLAVDKSFTVAGHLTFHQAAADEVTGIFREGVNYTSLNDWSASLLNPLQSLVFDINFNLATSEDYYYCVILKCPAGQNITNLQAGLIINTTSDEALPFVSNSGSIIKMRPIALSALVTCTLPELTAGGNIVGYSAPPGDIDNYYYQTSNTIGPYQDWQLLARNNKGKNTHDGNFKDGTYVWTQPWETNDTLMRTPMESLNYPYQGIIISGQVNPTVNLSGLVEIGRIRICILYEYTTDNRLFDPEPCYGSPQDLSWCLNFLASHQHACQNKDHLKVLKDIIQGAAGWIHKSIPAMKTGLDIASGIAKLML